YLAGGKYAEAEQLYRELLAHDERMVVARNNLALALADQGEFDAALEEIGKALDQAGGGDLADELKDTEQTIRDMRGGN
ncbi:MAG: tetratricopeptide repeat protein, partial [Woeseiaceae bacterium]